MKILGSTQYHNWAKYVQKLILTTNQSGFQHVEHYIPGHKNLHVLVAQPEGKNNFDEPSDQ